jgi:hypothetical protein
MNASREADRQDPSLEEWTRICAGIEKLTIRPIVVTIEPQIQI